jgi:hypothetical protein
MPWLLDLRLKPSLYMPSSRALACRPHRLPPPHHNLTPLDLGPCPIPPMPPLTLPASITRARRPSSHALASTPYLPMLSHLQQWLPLLLPSPQEEERHHHHSGRACPDGQVLPACSYCCYHTQQVVSGAAIVAPSNLERAKARCKRSTTHGPSHKEVMVIISPPTHWPNKQVVGPLNSYLGTHGRAIQAVTETWDHLRGLALMRDVLLVEADIQVMHAYFDTAAKRTHEDDTTKTQVEVGSSKSFLCIPNFPYFGAKLTYDANSKPVPITLKQVKEILLASKWKDAIHLYQGAMPHLVRNSCKFDTCTVFFNIYNSSGGHHLQSLKGCSFMLGHITLTIQPAFQQVGVPICPRCWRYGHCTMVCPFKTQLCAICAGPHQSEHHQVLGACCKAQPKAKPLQEATPVGHPCPHPARCINCSLNQVPTAAPALSGSTTTTPSGCTPNTQPRR